MSTKFRFSTPLSSKPQSGPALFLEKISRALIERGHMLVDKEEPHDIRLACVSDNMPYWQQRDIPVVLRLDGVYHDLAVDSEKLNRPILESYSQADALIFQIRFFLPHGYSPFRRTINATLQYYL